MDFVTTEYLIRLALGEDVPEPNLGEHGDILPRTLILGAIADGWSRDPKRIDESIVAAERAVAESGYQLATTE